MSEQMERQKEARGHLVAFAVGWLAEWCGLDGSALPPGLPEDSATWLEAYHKLLGESWGATKPGTPLLSIFSRVKLQDGDDPPQVYWPAVPLSLDEPVYPAEQVQPYPKLWEDFLAEWDRLPGGDAHFEAFTHLLHKWAWAVPCSYGEPGVSLYEEFRALSALVHASGCEPTPADDFLLVGGDIPGIQDFVYTITSKGAAKGLRGRSFFLQLLGDAVVRRLLAELDLPQTNVIYNAGGNFVLLGPTGGEEKLARIAHDINQLLLDTYEGDLALCLACLTMPAGAAGRAEFGARYSLALKQAITREKTRRFAELANGHDGWTLVFAPQGEGGERPRFCAVCQAELSDQELRDPDLVLGDVTELEPGEIAPRACYDCDTFRKLAEVLAHAHQALYLRHDKDSALSGVQGTSERWQELLYEISDGWWYRFASRAAGSERGETKLVLNSPDFLKLGAQGFQFLANTTPQVTPADVVWWNKKYPEQKGKIRVGGIRSFELLARAAGQDGAMARVGVLRMDVDDLGRVMTRGLCYQGKPHRTMAATSALSQALDRFFTGYLDALCGEVTRTPGMAGLPGHDDEKLLYVIYAGGDDLFVVGAWHLLPLLAHRVRDAFQEYVGGHPSLHISAGMTLEGPKFPLYQAATRAGRALNRGAKRHKYLEKKTEGGKELKREKNAVHWLGQTLGWDDFADVRERTGALASLIKQQGVPRGLLQTLQMIYGRFLSDKQETEGQTEADQKLFYGPWMWQQAYHLKRFVEGKPDMVKTEVDALQEWTLQPQRIQRLGLVARWAEYLTRGKEA